jgi:phosphate uptake regulator
MKRKVVQHGPSTLIISLPSKWVQKFNIKKGDELEVNAEGSCVRICTQKAKTLSKVTSDASGLDRNSLVYLVRSLYKLGYSDITLNYRSPIAQHHRLNKDQHVISIIHGEINRLTGIEVIQQRDNFCVMKVLSEMSSTEFNTILRRVFLLLIDMNQDFIDSIKKQDKNCLLTLENKHNTITKFVSFCMRLINKHGTLQDSKNPHIMYALLTNIDNVVDVIKNCGRFARHMDPKISKKGVEIMQLIHESLVAYYNLFYNYNHKTLDKLNFLRAKVLESLVNDYDSLDKKEIVIINKYAIILELLLSLSELRSALEF